MIKNKLNIQTQCGWNFKHVIFILNSVTTHISHDETRLILSIVRDLTASDHFPFSSFMSLTSNHFYWVIWRVQNFKEYVYVVNVVRLGRSETCLHRHRRREVVMIINDAY